MGRVMAWTCITSFFLSLVTATILSNITFLPVLPDLVLLVIVYVSFVNGTSIASSASFCSGLMLDFLSAAPIGLNAFTKTLTGYVAGRFSGACNLDRALIPALMGIAATVLKALSTWVLSLFFGSGIQVYRLSGAEFWLEILANAIAAPLLFAVLGMFPSLFVRRRS
jgi:rod shape-determining protein MreD